MIKVERVDDVPVLLYHMNTMQIAALLDQHFRTVLAYRGQYRIERGFGRLKGRAPSLTPLFLQQDRRIIGLIRLLSIALRVLTLLEFVVRRQLEKEGNPLKGLYAGNPQRAPHTATSPVQYMRVDHGRVQIFVAQ